MNRKSTILIASSVIGLTLFWLFQESKSYEFKDWYQMGVYTNKKIPAGSTVRVEDLEERPLSLETTKETLKDNIKSIGSAMDRPTKKIIEAGQLLMYKDLGEQPYVFGRPHPESEIE